MPKRNRVTKYIESIPYPQYTGNEPCSNLPTEYFYPQGVRDYKTAEIAKTACGLCPMRSDCREYALAHELWGIWGGMGESERTRERKRRGWTLADPAAEVSHWTGVAYGRRA